jgi:heat shock protein HslJ
VNLLTRIQRRLPLPALPLLALLLAVTVTGCSVLNRQPNEEVLFGSWRVESIDDERIAVGVNTSEWPTVEFSRSDDDNMASGSLGCNQWDSYFDFDGQQLEFRNGSSTAMECLFGDGPADGEQNRAMRVEILLSEILFPGPLMVNLDGATLILMAGNSEVKLVRVGDVTT